MKRLPILLTALVLFVAACGESEEVSDTPTTGAPTTGAPTTTTTIPTPETTTTTVAPDPDRLVLRITDEGGFAPVEFMINQVPRFSLYAGGTLLFQGIQTAIFPGPVLAPISAAILDTAQMNEVMAAIEAVGLPDIDDEIDTTNNSRVADANTTVATYRDPQGRDHVFGVYALGLLDGGSSATRSLQSLVDLVDRLAFEAADGGFYEPDRLLVHVGTTEFIDSVVSSVQPWALRITPPEFVQGRFGLACAVIDGPDAIAAVAVFADANQATRWDFEGTEYRLLARPLLPGEAGCSTG